MSRQPATMLGAIAGDIVGSVYEAFPIKNVDFSPLFHKEAVPTDDTVLTVATANALLTDRDYASAYKTFARKYPYAGYGPSFDQWFRSKETMPYNSWGNGSAMRVSPVGWAFDSREEVLEEAKASASVTHNHPEGIKGAQATALAIFLARTGSTKEEIKHDVEATIGYDLSSKNIDEIRRLYEFDVSCQGSVPESILAFLESESVEHAIRLAVSLGGDSDTQACIAGSIAEAYYGPLPPEIAAEVRKRLPPDCLDIVDLFQKQFVLKEEKVQSDIEN